MNTSLWEVEALEKHYFPATATIAKGIELSNEVSSGSNKRAAQGAGATSYDLDEFASYTYAILFEQEVKRRLKDTPLALHPRPTNPQQSLFQSADYFDEIFELSKSTSN